MTRDELEFSISQYLDGTLPEDARSALQSRLESDPEAEELLRQERALTGLLRSDALPAVHWDGLADAISSAIDVQQQVRMDRASWLLRMRMPGALAAAASVLIVGGIAVHYLLGTRPATHPNPQLNRMASSTLLVEGPQPDRVSAAQVTEISIGPGGVYAKDSSLAPYADEIDTRPSHVIIAGAASVGQRPGSPF